MKTLTSTPTAHKHKIKSPAKTAMPHASSPALARQRHRPQIPKKTSAHALHRTPATHFGKNSGNDSGKNGKGIGKAHRGGQPHGEIRSASNSGNTSSKTAKPAAPFARHHPPIQASICQRLSQRQHLRQKIGNISGNMGLSDESAVEPDDVGG